MANIKQDELWVDLLFDGTTSFYLALAESKRFRLGHIRNGKISYQLYPKRKDFVSLNAAIKNLAALHCYFVPQEKSSQADKGCKIWSQKRFFKDGCLNPIKEVLWLLFTCMALQRHLSKRKDTIWCWRLFLSETCIGFTMHNVTAPALHVKCLSCTLSRSALDASLCIDVFLLQKSISAKQYLTASLWVSTKNYVRIW